MTLRKSANIEEDRDLSFEFFTVGNDWTNIRWEPHGRELKEGAWGLIRNHTVAREGPEEVETVEKHMELGFTLYELYLIDCISSGDHFSNTLTEFLPV